MMDAIRFEALMYFLAVAKSKLKEQLEAIPGVHNMRCKFCRKIMTDESRFGKIYVKGSITCHYFCLLLATKLIQRGNDHEGIFGFRSCDIQNHLNDQRLVRCYYCRKKGATVYCCVPHCRKVFHLPCGLSRKSFHEFFASFKSFCPAHSIERTAAFSPPVEYIGVPQTCCICHERLIPLQSSNAEILWVPCCNNNAWFHKTCMQLLALNAGYYFKCPLCNDKRMFRKAMVNFGIFIPAWDATWESETDNYDDMYTVYEHCDALICLSTKGRDDSVPHTRFEIIRCKYCGSKAVHKTCGNLRVKDKEWACQMCSNPALADVTNSRRSLECTRMTVKASEFFSSADNRSLLPSVNLEKYINIPPSIRIGDTSLRKLQESGAVPYERKTANNTGTIKNTEPRPGCSFWGDYREATQPQNADVKKDKISDNITVNQPSLINKKTQKESLKRKNDNETSNNTKRYKESVVKNKKQNESTGRANKKEKSLDKRTNAAPKLKEKKNNSKNKSSSMKKNAQKGKRRTTYIAKKKAKNRALRKSKKGCKSSKYKNRKCSSMAKKKQNASQIRKTRNGVKLQELKDRGTTEGLNIKVGATRSGTIFSAY